jgi:hypothetical protein
VAVTIETFTIITWKYSKGIKDKILCYINNTIV